MVLIPAFEEVEEFLLEIECESEILVVHADLPHPHPLLLIMVGFAAEDGVLDSFRIFQTRFHEFFVDAFPGVLWCFRDAIVDMELVQDANSLWEAFSDPGLVRLGHVRADESDSIRISALGYYPVPDVSDGLYIMADHTAYRGTILVCDHCDVVLAVGALNLVDEQRMRGRQLLVGPPFLHELVEDIGHDMLPDLAGPGCRGHGLLR